MAEYTRVRQSIPNSYLFQKPITAESGRKILETLKSIINEKANIDDNKKKQVNIDDKLIKYSKELINAYAADVFIEEEIEFME